MFEQRCRVNIALNTQRETKHTLCTKIYIAACNATKLNAKYPQRHLKLFCLLLLYVCRVPYVRFCVRCSLFRTRSMDFHSTEGNNNFLKHSLMALSLCDTDFRAFTHIFCYFFPRCSPFSGSFCFVGDI